jgi:hypothetical protein
VPDLCLIILMLREVVDVVSLSRSVDVHLGQLMR